MFLKILTLRKKQVSVIAKEIVPNKFLSDSIFSQQLLKVTRYILMQLI